MYRIHFDPNVSKFVVQFLIWGCFWKTCMVHREDLDGPHSARLTKMFDTYADAAKWVSDKGIPEAYEVQQPKKSVYTRLSTA